jgi:hypothetical protein
MTGTNFKDYGINILPAKDGDTTASDTVVDLSKMKKGFILSRIVVSDDAAADDSTFSDSEIAKIKKTLGVEDIPDEEAEKFGLKDHPLHKDHLKQAP